MKKILFIGLLVPVAFGLSGCFSTKKAAKKTTSKKSSKKLASRSSGSGVPLARYKVGNTRFWDEKVEAFILEGEEQDQRYAPIKISHKDSMAKEKRELREDKVEHVDFEPVYFSYDNYTIRKDQEAVVQYDTQQAKEAVKGGKVVRVEGHSDKKCISETYNMAVSQKRANTVSKRLASAGISSDKIKAVGYGDSKVAVDVEGREQRNRRVEFTTLIS